jgi:hypothetical protein
MAGAPAGVARKAGGSLAAQAVARAVALRGAVIFTAKIQEIHRNRK